MIKYLNGDAFCYIGKFRGLIAYLSAIEDKQITVREYIQIYRRKLN